MATVEGRGNVAPAPVGMSVPSYAVVSMRDEAERRSGFRNYGGRTDQWGKGLLGSDPALPILVGLVGEWAFAEFVNSRTGKKFCETDFKLRKRGDGGCDFRILGTVHQLKTKRDVRGENLIRRVDQHGKTLDLLPGRYVFAQWDPAIAVCHLLGWCLAEVVLDCPFEPARVGMHTNLRVPNERLNSMASLISAIQADMEEDLCR